MFPIGLRDSTRQLATVLAVGSGLALATGLFVQHGLGYAPCSLCVLQRLAFIVVLIVTLPLAMFRLPRTATMVLVGLALVATLLGLGVASYQVWMQAYPAEVGRCGRGLEAYFDDSPFETLANWVLAAEGDCGKPVTFLGLVTLPHLGLLAFAVMAGVALRMSWLSLRRGSRRSCLQQTVVAGLRRGKTKEVRNEPTVPGSSGRGVRG
ncbi:MAG: disulfide bond formation protein B [Xanthomonadales bacterium]|nr:disulfide bond formation protein B [Xanthomonadales bacterium]